LAKNLPQETTPLLVTPASPQRITSPRLCESSRASISAQYGIGACESADSGHIATAASYGHPAQIRTQVVHAAEQAGYKRYGTGTTPRDNSWTNGFHLRSPVSRPVPEDAVAIEVEETVLDNSSLTMTPSNHHQPTSPHAPANEDSHHHPHGNKKAGGHDHERDHDHDHHHHHENAEDAEETLAQRGYGNATSAAHSHGSMNMHALLLHVLGDALGNVGVIASGLIIWLSDWKWRFLSDPIISLVITVIIFTSALPLGELILVSRCLIQGF